MTMQDRVQRSSNSRILSFIVLLGIIPAWFFYLGIQYWKTITVIEENQQMLEEYIPPIKKH